MLKAVALPLFALAFNGSAYAQVGYSMANMIPKVSEESVSKITDGELTCEQLYAEYGYLGDRIAQLPKVDGPAEIAKMQQQTMASIGGGGGARMVGGLLNQVPGGSLISSLASSASAAATRARMQKQMQAQMDVATKYIEVETLRQPLQVRRTRVMNLFIERTCRVATLDLPAVRSSTERLVSTNGESSLAFEDSAPTIARGTNSASPPAIESTAAFIPEGGTMPVADPPATDVAPAEETSNGTRQMPNER